jgi:hypothetical protein
MMKIETTVAVSITLLLAVSARGDALVFVRYVLATLAIGSGLIIALKVAILCLERKSDAG